MPYKRFVPVITFCIVIILTIFVYLPGLKGGFLFDDYSNLGEMGKYGDISEWDNAKRFVMGGIAGPTGRPIALATFLLSADSWPIDAFPFKLFNLCIHILSGILLYCATLLLLRAYGFIEKKAVWVALLSASFWLVHPLFVSTTLYVVQRMAQLAMLFGVIGIVGYLKGRALLATRPVWAYLVMTLSIGLCTILATYSKENGALLPLLILTIEYCNPIRSHKPIWYWRAIFLWLPSFLIAVMLIRYVDFSDNPWPNRLFNQVERLLSESRIVCDYLLQLFMPRIEGQGLFQDGFIISTGLLSPLSTLFSIVFLIVLLIAGFILRKSYPLTSLAILFFFAAHLMESTVIGLELYFEHRNYVAAMFLFLPLAAVLYALSEKIRPNLVVLISCLILSMLASMTYQRAILWSDNDKLQLYWAQNNPNSERGQSLIARHLLMYGKSEESIHVLESALGKKPNSGLLSFQLLLHKVNSGTANQQDFITTRQRIFQQRADPQTIFWIRDIVINISRNEQLTAVFALPMIEVLDKSVEKGSPYNQIPKFKAMMSFLKGMLYTALGEKELAYQQYSQSLAIYRDVDIGLSMAADLANRGYYQLALQLLDQVDIINNSNSDIDLKRPKQFYTDSIRDLRENIQSDIPADK
jgi:tetratricopeptide (TPR) repeat protein